MDKKTLVLLNESFLSFVSEKELDENRGFFLLMVINLKNKYVTYNVLTNESSNSCNFNKCSLASAIRLSDKLTL